MHRQSGGFYSAEDADSYPTPDSDKKKEGAFCVWTYEEIHKLLKAPLRGTTDSQVPVEGEASVADLFAFHYHVLKSGNVDEFKVRIL